MHNFPNWLNFLKEENEKGIFKQDDQKLGNVIYEVRVVLMLI